MARSAAFGGNWHLAGQVLHIQRWNTLAHGKLGWMQPMCVKHKLTSIRRFRGSILNYQYSPAGIFPSGFSAVDVNRHFTATTAAGCLSGWTNVGGAYCSKQVDAVWQAQGAETNGPFSAIMPQISITWAPSDLSWISPMTAPASMVREFYAARETSRNASSHSTATRVPKMTENSSLSTGVKAGIGVGVAVAVLLLCLIGLGSCLLLKRRKQDPSPPESPKPQDERQPYLDRKPELATYEVKEISNDGLSQRSNEERTELETNEVYELDTGWLPYEAAAIKQSEKPTAKESPPLSPISLHSDAQSVRSSLSLEGQDEGMAPKS